MSDLHLPQKMIIFAVGKETMCFPFFHALLQKVFQDASKCGAICVKLHCHLRQVVRLSDVDCNAICLILRIKKKEMSTPFGFYGKTEQRLPTFNVNNYENFQLFFCSAKWCFSHMISTLLTSPCQYERHGVKSL